MELLALLLKYLISILLPPAHPLQLSQILAVWKRFFQLGVLVLVCFELGTDVLEGQTPLLLQRVVFLEAGAHMPLILLVVFADLRLALLEDLDFEPALARPLLAQVLIKLFD